MNTRVKGRKNELKAKKTLEDQGYTVEVTKSPSKWQKQQDLFGLWDMMAIKADDILFIQVKTNRNAPKEFYDKVALWPCPNTVRKQVWVYYDRVKEPRIFDIHA